MLRRRLTRRRQAPNATFGRTGRESTRAACRKDRERREESGGERHLRVNDVPVREGQYLRYLWLAGPGLSCGDGAIDYGLISPSVGEFWEFPIRRLFAHRKWLWALGAIALLSLLSGYFAIVVIPIFFIAWYLSSRRRRKHRNALLGELRAIVAELRNRPAPVRRAAAS